MLISIPATSANLGPGFDTLGLAIDIRNKIIIEKSRFLSTSVRGEGEKSVKIRKNSLFLDIFYKTFYELKGNRENFRFVFLNNIPISRGLGSSSAVVIGAIVSAHIMANAYFTKSNILNMALKYENHPDNITSAIMGGFNISCLDNGKIYSKNFRLPEYLKAILVIPNKITSTKKSRGTLSNKYNLDDIIYSLSRSSFMTALFASNSWNMLRVASKDRLHQNERMKEIPELFKVQKISLDNGALMSTLSGSGSTFFTLCYNRDSNRIYSILKNNFPYFRVVLSSLSNYGIIYKS